MLSTPALSAPVSEFLRERPKKPLIDSKAHRAAEAMQASSVWVNCYGLTTRPCPSAATSNPASGVS